MCKNEPSKELSLKKANSTTFKQCGWCKYAMGTHRYSYCISGRCLLCRRYDPKITWDTQCLFKQASTTDIQALIDYHNYEIQNAQMQIVSEQGCIKLLKQKKKKAMYRPPLPSDRAHDHFNINNPIAVFINKEWAFGKVKNGYRHHDGCVSYCLEGIGPQKANDIVFPYQGGYWDSGVAAPNVMLRSEYDFFEQHTKQYIAWCDAAYGKEYHGKILERPTINRRKK